MGKLFSFIISITTLIGLLPTITRAATDHQRIAVVIGNNVGMEDELKLVYAENDAEKIRKVLTDLGGFKPQDIYVLTGKTATELQQLFRQILISRTAMGLPRPEQFFFYYSGHSNGTTLHMQETKLMVNELRILLDGMHAQITVALIDSCRSGALTRGKGASLGPSYHIDFLHDPELEGRIIITSSSDDEISQESDKIEGSFFTHHWVSGLYGKADSNQDDLVTLEEAYRYAYFQTVDNTLKSQGGVQHPSYNFSLTGQGHMILSNLAQSTAKLHIIGEQSGQYFILDAKKQLVLTELTQTKANSMRIRLPPGWYQIRKREKDQILIADVSIEKGKVSRISDTDMNAIPYTTEQAKTASPIPIGLLKHGPEISTGVRTGLFPAMTPAWQIRSGYFSHGSIYIWYHGLFLNKHALIVKKKNFAIMNLM